MKDCGGCTLCCKLLETHDMPSKRGVYCTFCSAGKGCTIYEIRPAECREYQCMWSQMDQVGIEMRPDKSHIIFDKISDRTICAVQDPDYELNKLVMGQIRAFLKEGFSVVVIKGDKKGVYVAQGHSFEEAKEEVIRRAKDGRAKLHRRFNRL